MISITRRARAPRPVSIIRLERPEKKNALTPGMLDDLCSALAQSADSAAIVLAGAGSAFCSGFDLTLCRENSDALADLLSGLSRAIRLMRDLPAPVVLAAHGAAIAGGCALLGGADVVVTHADCRLGYPVVRLGISPAVTAPFLTGAIGPGPTRDRLLGGELISGSEALACGLAHALADTPEQVADEAAIIADALAAKPACGVSATKRWMNDLDALAPRAPDALAVSLSLVNSPEERERLARLWSGTASRR